MANIPDRRCPRHYGSSFAPNFDPPPSIKTPSPFNPHSPTVNQSGTALNKSQTDQFDYDFPPSESSNSNYRKRRRSSPPSPGNHGCDQRRCHDYGVPSRKHDRHPTSCTIKESEAPTILGSQVPSQPPQRTCNSDEDDDRWGSTHLRIGSDEPPSPPRETQPSQPHTENEHGQICGQISSQAYAERHNSAAHSFQGQNATPLSFSPPPPRSQDESYYRQMDNIYHRSNSIENDRNEMIPPGRRKKNSTKKAKKHRKRIIPPGPAGMWYQMHKSLSGRKNDETKNRSVDTHDNYKHSSNKRTGETNSQEDGDDHHNDTNKDDLVTTVTSTESLSQFETQEENDDTTTTTTIKDKYQRRRRRRHRTTTKSSLLISHDISNSPAWQSMSLSLNIRTPYLDSYSYYGISSFSSMSSSCLRYKYIRPHVPSNYALIYEIHAGQHDLHIPQIIVCVTSVQCYDHCDWTVELRDESSFSSPSSSSSSSCGSGGSGSNNNGTSSSTAAAAGGVGNGGSIMAWLEERFVKDFVEWVRPGVVWLCKDVRMAVFPTNDDGVDDDDDEHEDVVAIGMRNNPALEEGQNGSRVRQGGGRGGGVERMLLIGESNVVYAWMPEDASHDPDDEFKALMEERTVLTSKVQEEMKLQTTSGKQKDKISSPEEKIMDSPSSTAVCSNRPSTAIRRAHRERSWLKQGEGWNNIPVSGENDGRCEASPSTPVLQQHEETRKCPNLVTDRSMFAPSEDRDRSISDVPTPRRLDLGTQSEINNSDNEKEPTAAIRKLPDVPCDNGQESPFNSSIATISTIGLPSSKKRRQIYSESLKSSLHGNNDDLEMAVGCQKPGRRPDETIDPSNHRAKRLVTPYMERATTEHMSDNGGSDKGNFVLPSNNCQNTQRSSKVTTEKSNDGIASLNTNGNLAKDASCEDNESEVGTLVVVEKGKKFSSNDDSNESMEEHVTPQSKSSHSRHEKTIVQKESTNLPLTACANTTNPYLSALDTAQSKSSPIEMGSCTVKKKQDTSDIPDNSGDATDGDCSNSVTTTGTTTLPARRYNPYAKKATGRTTIANKSILSSSSSQKNIPNHTHAMPVPPTRDESGKEDCALNMHTSLNATPIASTVVTKASKKNENCGVKTCATKVSSTTTSKNVTNGTVQHLNSGPSSSWMSFGLASTDRKNGVTDGGMSAFDDLLEEDDDDENSVPDIAVESAQTGTGKGDHRNGKYGNPPTMEQTVAGAASNNNKKDDLSISKNDEKSLKSPSQDTSKEGNGSNKEMSRLAGRGILMDDAAAPTTVNTTDLSASSSLFGDTTIFNGLNMDDLMEEDDE